jgi:intermediate cleaving peptidase 55
MEVLYPHTVGHYLGLQVHDTPSVSRSHRLQPGNVITIEPGAYIPDLPSYPARCDYFLSVVSSRENWWH